MYPHERSLVKQLAGKPFALIGVNSDSDRDEIKQKIKTKNLNWRSFWNGKDGTAGPISVQWNISGWPTTYVIDAKGVIRHRNLRGGALDRALENLLAEAGHEVKISHGEAEEEKKDKKKKDGEKDGN